MHAYRNVCSLIIFSFVLILSCSFIISHFLPLTHAQTTQTTITPPNSTPGEEISLTPNPEYPRAHEEVVITAKSFYIDLDRAAIAWYINDVKQTEGFALKQFRVKTGELGERMKISMVAVDGNKRANQIILLNPSEVEIVWEATTYTPPFLKIKAPYTNQSDIRAIALPRIKGYNPEELIYEWRKDGTFYQKGRGLNSILIQGSPIVEQFIISVRVESPDKYSKAYADVRPEPVFPSLLTYFKSATEGILFNNVVKTNTTVNEQEFTLSTFPYGFSTPNRYLENAPIYWVIGGENPTNQGEPELTFRKAADGNITISAFARTAGKVLQFANNQLKLTLKNE